MLSYCDMKSSTDAPELAMLLLSELWRILFLADSPANFLTSFWNIILSLPSGIGYLTFMKVKGLCPVSPFAYADPSELKEFDAFSACGDRSCSIRTSSSFCSSKMYLTPPLSLRLMILLALLSRKTKSELLK